MLKWKLRMCEESEGEDDHKIYLAYGIMVNVT